MYIKEAIMMVYRDL